MDNLPRKCPESERVVLLDKYIERVDKDGVISPGGCRDREEKVTIDVARNESVVVSHPFRKKRKMDRARSGRANMPGHTNSKGAA